MKFKIAEIPKGARTIGSILNQNGYQAYVVGGAVRDWLLGRNPKDWDIATDAKPDDILPIFEEQNIKVWPLGKKFGIVKMEIEGQEYDVATFRKKIEFEEGKSKVGEYSDNINDDLAFRDLTINALAMNIQTGEIIDPFGGQKDLEQGIIRAIGDPDERMKEGPIRTLRAVRFAVKYGFKIDPETEATIKRQGNLLSLTAGGRIKRELNAILMLNKASVALKMLTDMGLSKVIFPEVNLMDVIEEIDKTPKNLVDRWATILKNTGKGKKINTEVARQIMRKLGFSLAEIEPVNRKIYAQSEQKLTAADLDITAAELQKLGVKPEDMQTVQNQLIDLIVFRPEKNKNSILKNRAKKWLQGVEITK
jgi:tRNA nucleotidyltransferase (CCA-adding enzyme)